MACLGIARLSASPGVCQPPALRTGRTDERSAGRTAAAPDRPAATVRRSADCQPPRPCPASGRFRALRRVAGVPPVESMGDVPGAELRPLLAYVRGPLARTGPVLPFIL